MTLSSEEARHEALDRPKRRRKAANRPHGGGVHGGFRHRPTARGEHKPRAVGATRAPHPATLRGRLGAARWATEWNKTLTETALENLVAAAQAEPNYLEQLYAFGSVERSAEAQRTVTIAYWAQFRDSDFQQQCRQEQQNIAWFCTDDLPPLAFDHAEIIDAGIDRLRRRTEKALVAHRFLEDSFTIAELRHVQEVILGRKLDP